MKEKHLLYLKKEGFTLIELIVVMIIISILASIIIVKYFSVEEESKRKVIQGVVAELQTRANLAYAKGALAGLSVQERIPDIDDFDGQEGRFLIVNRPLPDKEQLITLAFPNEKTYYTLYYEPPGIKQDGTSPAKFRAFFNQ